MQFSNTIAKNGILQHIEIVTGLGLTTITGDANLLAYFTSLVNIWLHITNQWIQNAQGEWAYDDANHADFPIETFAFVDDQQDYGLTSGGEKDSLMIKRVEAQDVADNNWHDLSFLPQNQIPEDWTGQTKGRPSKYWLNGGSIFFDVPIDVTEVDNYRLTYDRNAHIFVTTDTSAEPGFDVKFHPILVYGPSREKALLDKKNEVINLCDRMLGDNPKSGYYRQPGTFFNMIERFYQDRAKEAITNKSRFIGYR